MKFSTAFSLTLRSTQELFQKFLSFQQDFKKIFLYVHFSNLLTKSLSRILSLSKTELTLLSFDLSFSGYYSAIFQHFEFLLNFHSKILRFFKNSGQNYTFH